jgi:hypothetical protein
MGAGFETAALCEVIEVFLIDTGPYLGGQLDSLCSNLVSQLDFT